MSLAGSRIREVVARRKALRLTKAAELVEAKAQETLTYFAFPSNHWRQIKTNNPLKRIIREIRRRTRVGGAFPNGHSVLLVVAVRLRHIATTKSGKRRYLAMETLLNLVPQRAAASDRFRVKRTKVRKILDATRRMT